MSEYAIEMKNITKIFNQKLIANEDITFRVKKGEIHSLIGENGAGKSTLMSILFGLYEPTSGEILINGRNEFINSPIKARKLKIGMVHQHFKLVENYKVWQNIALGTEDTTAKQFINANLIKKRIFDISNKYNLPVEINAKISNVSVAQQQRIEILKILYHDADILIFDEPTAVLTPSQIDDLLKIILNLKKAGKTIVFISHKLHEVKKISDTATIIRKGRLVDTFDVSKSSVSEMAEKMVGRKLVQIKNISTKQPGENYLVIKNLTVPKISNTKLIGLDNVSFNLRSGEILAIAGVEGNGQTEMIGAITGLISKPNSLIRYFARLLGIHEDYKKDLKETRLPRKLEKDIYSKTLEVKYSKNSNADILDKLISELDELKNKAKKHLESDETKQKIKELKVRHMELIKKFSNPKKSKETSSIKMIVPCPKCKTGTKICKFDHDKQNTIIEKEVFTKNIATRQKIGMSHIPEDRHKHGMLLDVRIMENMVLEDIPFKPYSRYGLINSKEIQRTAQDTIKKFDVRGSNSGFSIARGLSGGNQQKAVLGREMTRPHKVLVVVQPTRGLDVGAIEFVHKKILEEKESGVAILLVSYELEEVMSLADKIIVLNKGRIIGELDGKKAKREEIGLMMAGGKKVINSEL
ncbi:ABC transporter ATP-binding protein [Spiroplasma endosymbiont of Amphibalanus improvisus]|uniref:ABC transporter ATP-binding protein n=1 Tax=Spiroplasma endosymbiont of Amphibalanus improvisus TaxID=3066327 RepID=UPI00313C2D59